MSADEYSLIAVGLPIDILESAILVAELRREVEYPRRGNTILVNDDFYIDILLKTSTLKESFDENVKYHARYTPEAKSLKDPDFVKKYYNELLRFHNILSDFVDEDAEFLENKLKKIFEETINII
jgi:tRNA A22 N-methylase